MKQNLLKLFLEDESGVTVIEIVEMCGQILLDIQRKVESVYEVKGKI